MAKGKSRYTSRPTIPVELKDRVQTITEALAGTISMSDGARRLGMARNHFQTLVHRGLGGLIESVTPQPAGRPATSPSEREQQEQIARLKRENEALKQRAETFDRLLMVAGDMLHGRTPTSRPRATKTKAETTPSETATNDEDEPAPSKREQAESMRVLGLRLRTVAALIGVSMSTLRRWKCAKGGGGDTRERVNTRLTDEQNAKLEALVRETNGMIGAEGLKRSVPGVSRRQAEAVKKRVVTAMERERLERTGSVRVRVPGVVRGFDAMHLNTAEGKVVLLVATDGAVPKRTTIAVAEHYDETNVAAAVEEDFGKNGAPLVWRADRAAVHDAPGVRDVLDRYGVVLLHGPARYPRYYGQLERQNREHREWLRPLGLLARNDVEPKVAEMQRVTNEVLPRRRLGWETAEQVWARDRHSVTDEERRALREAMEAERAKLRDGSGREKMTDQLIERLAIERALVATGWIEYTKGVSAR